MLDLLDGIRVADFTHVHAGPLCTYQLSLMGADVLKIEPPDGDQFRAGAGDAPGMSHGFVGQSAGKQSLCVDMKSAAGADVVRRVVESSDVLVQNMRPGVADKLGIGVDAVRHANPDIVYCAISGYGQSGPWADRPAFDHLVQGESGMFDATGPADGPTMRVGFAVADASTALVACSAVLAGLLRRERTGAGVFLDVSMLESCLTVMGLNNYTFLGSGRPFPRVGANPLVRVGSAGTFHTASGTLLVNGNNYRLFERMARAVGPADMLERWPREAFAERWEELRAEFAEIFVSDSADHWELVLTDAGVPVGQVRALPQVFANPQLEQRRAVAEVQGTRHLGAGFQADGLPSTPERPAPRLGQDSRAVLERLGYAAAEIDALLAGGSVRAE